MQRFSVIKGLVRSLCLFLLIGFSSHATEGKVTLLEPLDVMADQTYQIIDIREQYQYIGWSKGMVMGGHITNAIDFPMSWVTNKSYQDKISTELVRRGIDVHKKTVIYADDTVTDEDAKKYQALGFKELSVLKGGFKAYVTADYPVEKLQGYARYVHPHWVQDLMDGKQPEAYSNTKFIIIEMGFDKRAYLEGHIKGAVYMDASSFNENPGIRVLAEYDAIPMAEQLTFWDFPSDKAIKANLEKFGITHDTTVILYAKDDATTAANRAVLVMDYAGVKDIRLLNGGKTLWTLEGRPLDTADVAIMPIADFGVSVPQKPDIYINHDKERQLIDDPNAVIASIRSWPEYLGKISGYTYIGVAGDIKGSRFGYAGSNPYAMEDFRNLDNTLFNYKIINERWERWGITADKYVSFHCGTGWRAAETYYIAEALGWKGIGVYVGGWYQWSKLPNSPIMAKGLPKDAPEQEPQEFF